MKKYKTFFAALGIFLALFSFIFVCLRLEIAKVYAETPIDIQKEIPFRTNASFAPVDASIKKPEVDADDIVYIAKTIWGEGRGLSKYDKSLIAWCILNRVDDERFPGSVKGVVTQPYQFHGYSKAHPIDEECLEIAKDVLTRYALEKETGYDYGRTLPKKYVSFYGDGKRNYFRTTDKTDKYDFSLSDPYKED